MKLHEIQEKRSAAVSAMRALADKVEAESRDYTADEETRHAALKAEIAGLDTKIQRAKDIAEAERAAPAIIAGNGRDGAYEERARSFSIVRAIQAQCGDVPFDGLEREVSKELSTRTGRHFEGIGVPDEVFETRTITVGSNGAGESLYATQHRPDQFVDLRRSAMVTGSLGATVLSGLVGDQSIPRQIQASTAYHVAEDSDLTPSDADFDDIELSPTTVGALTSFSRRALLNAQPSVENLVRRDLAAVVARAIDYQALFGNGSGNTPTGVASQSNVFTRSLAGPTWAQVLDVIAAIQMADADISALGWAMAPDAIAKLRATPKDASNGGEGYLMESPSALAGYRVATSTSLSDGGSPLTSTVFFGAWSQLIIGTWSGVDLLANPFSDTAFPKGRVQVRAMQDYDVAVRHGQSFVKVTDLSV